MTTNPYESPRGESFDEVDESTAPDKQLGENLGPLHCGLFVAALLIVGWRIPELRDAALGRFSIYMAAPIAYSLIGASGLAGLALAVVRRQQKVATFPAQFGHWILIIYGVAWIRDQVLLWINRSLARLPLQHLFNPSTRVELAADPEQHLVVLRSLCWIVSCSVLWLAIRDTPGNRVWHRYAWMMILLWLWHAGTGYFFRETNHYEHWVTRTIFASLMILTSLTYVIALLRDWLKPRGLDQLHWVGALLPILNFGLIILLTVVFRCIEVYVFRL